MHRKFDEPCYCKAYIKLQLHIVKIVLLKKLTIKFYLSKYFENKHNLVSFIKSIQINR